MPLNWNKYKPLCWVMVLPALASFFLLAGCDAGDSQQSAPMSAPQVSTVTVTTQPVELSTELPGRVTSFREAAIVPQVNGLIQKRLFTEGSDVKAGDVLYQIDPAPFQAALDNAKASLGRSQANLPAARVRVDRYRDLLASNAVSKQDYDDALAAFMQVEADIRYGQAMVKTAKINLGYTKITAPISGRIGRSSVTEGALVSAHQPTPLTTIQQLDPIYADLTQSTVELLRLRRNLQSGGMAQKADDQSKVKLILEDGAAYPWEGALQFRDVTVDPTTGSVVLRVVCPNPEGILLPGMFIRAVVNEGIKDKAILIPQQAVSRSQKGIPLALIVNDQSKLEMRALKVDRAIGDQWLVTAGLEPGMKVVMEGALRLRPGVPVKAVPFQPQEQGQGGNANNGPSKPKSN